jgi:endonuclease G
VQEAHVTQPFKHLLAALVAAFAFVLPACEKKHPTEATPSQPAPGQQTPSGDLAPYPGDTSINVLMGDPSRSFISEQKDANNYYLGKPYFSISYNNEKGTPNWVSWCLQKSDLGPGNRVEFYPDTTLPKGFLRVVPRDYTNSGFDRGHMCPRSDRTATQEMANATFVMTNIVPQSPHLNQRGWADLEEYSRLLAKQGSTLYIVAGVHGVGGEGSSGPAEKISNGKVTVPAKCWKVILVIENGTGTAADIAKVGPTTRTIAIVMPNDQSIGHNWPKYRTSVQEVETLTGYKFFDRVPATIIDPLKTKVDDTKIPPVGKSSGD